VTVAQPAVVEPPAPEKVEEQSNNDAPMPVASIEPDPPDDGDTQLTTDNVQGWDHNYGVQDSIMEEESHGIGIKEDG
jgi:hypothetical protein